ncbi:hypothetical protein R1sor_005163 [Riccia sorocarpa]|uniref:IRS-type PTB domain-containing protein n=1 Tax=Riccia sorocarpa TaxID=122646 RepID=A0ABD3HM86_9MARC
MIVYPYLLSHMAELRRLRLNLPRPNVGGGAKHNRKESVRLCAVQETAAAFKYVDEIDPQLSEYSFLPHGFRAPLPTDDETYAILVALLHATQQLVRTLRSLSYGDCGSFTVRRIKDPTDRLPQQIILEINERGVKVFRPDPKERIISIKLKDIMQFGCDKSAAFLNVRVAGVLQIFHFGTKQGEEICEALHNHIDDLIVRRYFRSPDAAGGSASVPNGTDSEAFVGKAPAKRSDVGVNEAYEVWSRKVYQDRVDDGTLSQYLRTCNATAANGSLRNAYEQEAAVPRTAAKSSVTQVKENSNHVHERTCPVHDQESQRKTSQSMTDLNSMEKKQQDLMEELVKLQEKLRAEEQVTVELRKEKEQLLWKLNKTEISLQTALTKKTDRKWRL